MASKSTSDFRAAISHQDTEWLNKRLVDWRITKTITIQTSTMRARIIAMLRVELLHRQILDLKS